MQSGSLNLLEPSDSVIRLYRDCFNFFFLDCMLISYKTDIIKFQTMLLVQNFLSSRLLSKNLKIKIYIEL